MKTIKMMTLLTLILLTGFTVTAQKNKKNTATTTFEVDMTCNACVQKVQKNIPFERGVKAMDINLEDKKVTVTYDTRRTDVDKLKAGFKKIGFTATEAKVDGCCKPAAAAQIPLGADPDIACETAEKKCCSEKKADAACATAEKKCVAIGADADKTTSGCCSAQPASSVSQKICGKNG